jgi:NADH-quinone oxidoreductase subunit L
VSALIHAATMVTAGVYLIARVSPIYATVPSVGLVVAWVGVLTALLAALIACAQNDSKKILAYSTVSQLGYMFVGVGVGAQAAGVFHLLTHGFFKALLFLAAGSVMHAMANDTDVWRMGGLRRIMPITFWTSGTAWLAISGIPPFSGFFSKEEILVAALDTPGAQGIWLIGLVVAGITAFYMSRWFFLLFFGAPRWEHHEVHPHESPPSMTLPLVLLAVGSTAGGLINLPPEGWLHHWLEPSVVPYVGEQALLSHSLGQVLAVLAGVSGIAVAWSMYLRRAPVPAPATGIRALAANRFYVDELYERVIAWPGLALSNGFAAFDRLGIDGVVNGVARWTGALGGVGRRLQTGFVRSYALAVLAGTVLVIVLLVGGVAIGGGR